MGVGGRDVTDARRAAQRDAVLHGSTTFPFGDRRIPLHMQCVSPELIIEISSPGHEHSSKQKTRNS